MRLRRLGLRTDSGAIHGLCPGFPMPPVVDLGVGKKLGGGEGGARAAIVNGCCSPLCLVEVFAESPESLGPTGLRLQPCLFPVPFVGTCVRIPFFFYAMWSAWSSLGNVRTAGKAQDAHSGLSAACPPPWETCSQNSSLTSCTLGWGPGTCLSCCQSCRHPHLPLCSPHIMSLVPP